MTTVIGALNWVVLQLLVPLLAISTTIPTIRQLRIRVVPAIILSIFFFFVGYDHIHHSNTTFARSAGWSSLLRCADALSTVTLMENKYQSLRRVVFRQQQEDVSNQNNSTNYCQTVQQPGRRFLPCQYYFGPSLVYPETSRFKSPNDKNQKKNDSSDSPLNNNNNILVESMCSKTPQQETKLHKVQQQQFARPDDLHILYQDSSICVVHKPSGILSVPGPRRNPSITQRVYEHVFPENKANNNNNHHDHFRNMDQMVVHRIDMDTSGILVFALHAQALYKLHQDFRQRHVHKKYEALLWGHVGVDEINIDIALERDPCHPPFMRIAQDRTRNANNTKTTTTTTSVSPRFQKFLNQAPKESYTELQVLSRDYLTFNSHDTPRVVPVTRVLLKPHTGRTHQLR